MSPRYMGPEPFTRRDDAWAEHAACKGAPLDLFFPVSGKDPDVQVAKAYCDGCQVSAQCLAAATVRGDRFGIWGGLTEDERASKNRNDRRRALTAERRGENSEAVA